MDKKAPWPEFDNHPSYGKSLASGNDAVILNRTDYNYARKCIEAYTEEELTPRDLEDIRINAMLYGAMVSKRDLILAARGAPAELTERIAKAILVQKSLTDDDWAVAAEAWEHIKEALTRTGDPSDDQ